MKKLFSEHRALADICLVGALLILSGALYLFLSAGKDPGAWAVVRINGQEAVRYSMAEDGTYPLNGGTNILVVSGGEAWLTEADCPDKLCVRQGRIKYSGQCITCLPNKLTVTLEGGPDDGIDLVS